MKEFLSKQITVRRLSIVILLVYRVLAGVFLGNGALAWFLLMLIGGPAGVGVSWAFLGKPR